MRLDWSLGSCACIRMFYGLRQERHQECNLGASKQRFVSLNANRFSTENLVILWSSKIHGCCAQDQHPVKRWYIAIPEQIIKYIKIFFSYVFIKWPILTPNTSKSTSKVVHWDDFHTIPESDFNAYFWGRKVLLYSHNKCFFSSLIH